MRQFPQHIYIPYILKYSGTLFVVVKESLCGALLERKDDTVH